MPKVINFADPDGTGQTDYGVFVSQDQTWWYTTTPILEVYNAAHFAAYGVSAAEYGATGLYSVVVPSALPNGVYDVFVRRQVGGSPDPTDPVIYVCERVGWAGGVVAAGSVPASSPGLVTGYLYTYDQNGAIEVGVQVTAQVTGLGNSSSSVAVQTGFGLDEAVRTVTSDGAGLVSFTNLFKGVVYKFKRGSSAKEYSVEIPANVTSPYPLPSIIGAP